MMVRPVAVKYGQQEDHCNNHDERRAITAAVRRAKRKDKMLDPMLELVQAIEELDKTSANEPVSWHAQCPDNDTEGAINTQEPSDKMRCIGEDPDDLGT